jgi:hypothetical protein
MHDSAHNLPTPASTNTQTPRCRLKHARKAATTLKAARHTRQKVSARALSLKAACAQQQQQLAARAQLLEQGSVRLGKVQAERDASAARAAAADARAAEAEARLARAEGLMPKLEERCSSLGLERKRLRDRVGALTQEVAALQDRLKVGQGLFWLRQQSCPVACPCKPPAARCCHQTRSHHAYACTRPNRPGCPRLQGNSREPGAGRKAGG